MSTFSSNKESSFKIWLKTGRQESHRAETKVKMSSDWWIRMTANGICRICDKDNTHFLCGKWLGWPTLRQWCSFLSLAPFSVIYRTASCVLIVGHVSSKHRQISNETQICLLACKSKSTVEWSSTIDICHCSPESNPKQETTRSYEEIWSSAHRQGGGESFFSREMNPSFRCVMMRGNQSRFVCWVVQTEMPW